MKRRALLLLAAITAATMTGCTPQQPPVSQKVQEYYDNIASHTPAPPKVYPLVAFLGDSYTAGTGANPVSERWTTLLSARMGWTEANFGQGGTGYASQGPNPPTTTPYFSRVPNVAATEGTTPFVVIVAGGRNDLSVKNQQQVQDGITKTFHDLHEALPKAKIVALNPWGDATFQPPELAAMGTNVKAAVESVGGIYVDTGQPLDGRPSAIIDDKVHPNNEGHKLIADAVATALINAGVK